MNIVIFCLTILACCGIITKAYKAWKRADLKEKMLELEEISNDYDDIIQYKKNYKGKPKVKRKAIKNFYKE